MQLAEELSSLCSPVPGGLTDFHEEVKEDWMPLGIYAISEENSTADPNRYLQLVISKSGAVGGELHDLSSDTSTPVYDAIDKKHSTRGVESRGHGHCHGIRIVYLTQSETPVLVHQDGETTQEVMARTEDPSLAK